MAAPAGQQQQTQQQPAKRKPTPAQLQAAVVTALAVAVTAAALVAALSALFLAAGIGALALGAVAALVASWPAQAMEGTGPATRWAVRTNLTRRAAFLVAAARRVQAAADAAGSRDENQQDAVRAAIALEQRYQAQQVAASAQRLHAASMVDGMAAVYGPLLGWNSVKDRRCTPECRAADKHNFWAARPPQIGYPGTTHPNCRCWPSKPFRGAPILR